MTHQTGNVLWRTRGDMVFSRSTKNFWKFLWLSLVLRDKSGLQAFELVWYTHTHTLYDICTSNTNEDRTHNADVELSGGFLCTFICSLTWLLFRTRLAHFNPLFPLKLRIHTLHHFVRNTTTCWHKGNSSHTQSKSKHTELNKTIPISHIHKVQIQTTWPKSGQTCT